ncbi:hypothetical protein HCJ76_18110 [Streptomyces sp. MC1]|uniref:hypothetical protein n=1 Tax=Streptomyces sp. MC1 TaxID=295105 RepID=UPI0018C91E2D|nr:hypothetical protein [Streptomyces sp. MC1]MBG7699947.1 hypothetical protein [Streptomyces sp. MC1]
MSETEWNFSIFSAAPSGWRVAIADNKDQKLLVVGIVGWARLTSREPYAHTGDGDLEPFVLWDNVGDPFVSLLGRTLADWNSGSDEGRHHVHQILAPGREPHVPEGWSTHE